MKVRVDDLKEGCIISEDIYSLTNQPIIPSKTIVKEDTIDILKAFLIKEVEIDKMQVDGTGYNKTDSVKEDNNVKVQEEVNSLEDQFLIAVRKFKKEFLNWQAGAPLNINTIRQLMMPLIDEFILSPSKLFSLHHYSTKEEYLYQHCVAVGLLSAYMGKQLNLDKAEIVQLALGGCLADAGMSKVKNSILNKKTALTREEFEEIRQHPIQSYKMIKDITVLRDKTKVAILQHHERLDGSGYPKGSVNENISDYAKIIGLVDSFHAMTSNRTYRQKTSVFRVLEQMLEDNFGKYDINLLNILSKGINCFSIGTKVKLSNNTIAEIMFIDNNKPTRPLVRLIDEGIIIALEKNRQLYIEEIII